jgi:hypothetical protein
MFNIFKATYTNLFESKNLIKKIENKYCGKRVLLLGDGISAAYAVDRFKEYDAIIACNNAINNKYLENTNLLFHIIMEPDLLLPWKHNYTRKLWKNTHQLFPKTNLIMNPFGKLFNFLSNYKNIIYISPYHKIIKDKKVIYNDFTAAFQAALGVAIISGFDKIDCVGFDAWLLTPKNNLRWYSNTLKPLEFDYLEKSYNEDFIFSAGNLTQINVFTYGHYKSAYSFINEEDIGNEQSQYIPGVGRNVLMRDEFKKVIDIVESRYYPKGYEVK